MFYSKTFEWFKSEVFAYGTKPLPIIYMTKKGSKVFYCGFKCFGKHSHICENGKKEV